MSDRTTTNRLRDLLTRLRDAALTGSGDRPSNEELLAAAAEVSLEDGVAAIEEVFTPIDNMVILGNDSAQQVNARSYFRDLLFAPK